MASGESENDTELDFESEHFNPHRALHSTGLSPPKPRVKPLESVSKCRYLLPPEAEDSAAQVTRSHRGKSEDADERARYARERARQFRELKATLAEQRKSILPAVLAR